MYQPSWERIWIKYTPIIRRSLEQQGYPKIIITEKYICNFKWHARETNDPSYNPLLTKYAPFRHALTSPYMVCVCQGCCWHLMGGRAWGWGPIRSLPLPTGHIHPPSTLPLRSTLGRRDQGGPRPGRPTTLKAERNAGREGN